MILDHSEEILNLKPIESTISSSTRSTLSHDQVINWTKAEVRVDSDSVLCLGKLSILTEANRRWAGQVADFQLFASVEEVRRTNRIRVDNIFPGLTSLQILHTIQNDLQERNIKPEQCGERIILMSMLNDVEWTRKGSEDICISKEESHARSLDVLRSWRRKEVVWKLHVQT